MADFYGSKDIGLKSSQSIAVYGKMSKAKKMPELYDELSINI